MSDALTRHPIRWLCSDIFWSLASAQRRADRLKEETRRMHIVIRHGNGYVVIRQQ